MLMVLSVNTMLHHHHLGRICFNTEICPIDGDFNDTHTSDPCDEEPSDDSCELEQMRTFLSNAQSIHQFKHSVVSSSCLWLCLAPDALFPMPNVGKRQIYITNILFAHSEDYISSGGLRAPPFMA